MAAEAASMEESGPVPVPWWLILLEGIAALIIGVLLIAYPQATITSITVLLGIYWLIAGIFKIISIFIDSAQWGLKLLIGVLGIIAGIIILQNPFISGKVVSGVFVLVLGIDGIIIGILALIQAFQGGGWGPGIMGALSILFGIILLANTWIAALIALPYVLGIFAIIGGIAAIIMAFRVKD
jgi:uncharacterized membrane protein HdeD (DUF308 family)